MCRNEELSLTMSWIGCLLKDSELFILFAEISHIFLKIYIIPILLTGSIQSVGKQPTQLIVQTQFFISTYDCHRALRYLSNDIPLFL